MAVLSWVDAASYTERAWPGYEALIDLKSLSWRLYMNLCGMGSDPQRSAPMLVLANYRNKNYDMHNVQRVGCTIDIVSLSTIYGYTLHVRVGTVANRVPLCPRPIFILRPPFIRIGGSCDL